MTIINGIEIDDIYFSKNELKESINNNEPIEEKLNVIIVISNPCQFARRYILAREFIKRFDEEEENVELYVVELAYNKQLFHVTEANNKKHLQLRTNTVPIWHKENMINLGVKYLLPKSWKAFAWIDADIEFESASWALDTLKVLNGYKDIVQLFSHANDMDINCDTMNIFTSFGHQRVKERKYGLKGPNYWHPGFAYAITKKAYEKIGGLYQDAILGSGDNIIALSIINKGLKAINESSTDGYKESILEYQKNSSKLRLGYIPGIINHYFHGSKVNRKYNERWQILLKYNFDPKIHITTNNQGIIIPTQLCPQEMLDEIMEYFKERNEDECYIPI
jgi:hypothetical protein